MLILSFCSDPDILSVLYYVNMIVNLIKIAGPIVLIFASSIDIIKAVMASDQEGIQKNTHKIPSRLLLCACIFLIPSIIQMTLYSVEPENELTACLQAATPKKIQTAYKKIALEAVKAAEKQKTIGACNSADIAISKLKNSKTKTNYTNRVKTVRTTIEEDKNKTLAKLKETIDDFINNSNSSNSSNYGSISSDNDVVNYAQKFLGTPYVYGGNSLTEGIDCSGFTQQVYAHFGVTLPRTADAQSKVGTTVNGLSNAKPGDLLFFENDGDSALDHVAIYMGGGKRIHASSAKGYITIDSSITTQGLRVIKRVASAE